MLFGRDSGFCLMDYLQKPYERGYAHIDRESNCRKEQERVLEHG